MSLQTLEFLPGCWLRARGYRPCWTSEL